jgi:small subunit ribosomal protein S8
MMTDPIADMLTRIRNAIHTEAPSVDVPYSKIKHEICKVLVSEGFLVQFSVLENKPQNILRVQLKYGPEGEKVIQRIRRISKPGCRVYRKSTELRPVLQGLGVSVLSTSVGIMSDRQARARKVGGEVICEVF